jgi:hypothetical protein
VVVVRSPAAPHHPRWPEAGSLSSHVLGRRSRAASWQQGCFREVGHRKEVAWWLGAMAAAGFGGPAHSGINRGSRCSGGHDVDDANSSVAAKASAGRCGRGELGATPREAKGRDLRRSGGKKKEGEGGVRLGGMWRKREGSGHGVGHEVKAAPARERQCQAGARCVRKRERDAKLVDGPPEQWGPAAEGEKKGREGDWWDRLGVRPAGSERRERPLTGGPLDLNKFDLFQTNSTHSDLI